MQSVPPIELCPSAGSRRSLRQFAVSVGPALLVVLASIAYQAFEATHADVSWYITLSERLLDGQRAYVDFVEVNPPASILLYVPAVFIARLLGIAPEWTVKAMMCLLAWSCWQLCERITGAGRDGPAGLRGARLAILALIFVFLPGSYFAQREHFIAIALLPMITALVARAEGAVVDPRAAVAAGLAAGAAVAVKPHFILAVLAPLAWVAWHSWQARRDILRVLLSPELISAAGVLIAYTVSVQLFFPAFVASTLPVVLDAYVVFRCDLLELVQNWNFLVWAYAVVTIAAVSANGLREPRTIVPLLASAGCLAAWLIQGKAWINQGYPAVAIALATLADVTLARWRTVPCGGGSAVRTLRWAPAAVLAALLTCTSARYFSDPYGLDPLRVAMARLDPRPRVMAIASMLTIGHPLVREIGGTWVGHSGYIWANSAAQMLLSDPRLGAERRRRILGYVKHEKALTAADIEAFRPDYILVAAEFGTADPHERPPGFDEDWIRSTPQLVEALKAYRPVATARLEMGRIDVWGRLRTADAASARR